MRDWLSDKVSVSAGIKKNKSLSQTHIFKYLKTNVSMANRNTEV